MLVSVLLFNPNNLRGVGEHYADVLQEEVIDRRLRFRPSVAFIQKSGIVRDRVNMFRQLGNSISVPLESISGRVGLVQILFEIRIEV